MTEFAKPAEMKLIAELGTAQAETARVRRELAQLAICLMLGQGVNTGELRDALERAGIHNPAELAEALHPEV